MCNAGLTLSGWEVAEVNIYENYFEDFKNAVNNLPGAGDLAEKLLSGDVPDVAEILNFLSQNVLADLADYIRLLSVIMVIIIISSLVREVSGNLRTCVDFAGCATAVIYIIKSGIVSESMVFEGIEAVAVFVKAFIPIFAALCALSGNITLSCVYGGVSLLCMSFFSAVNTKLLVPLINMILSIGIISFVTGGDTFLRVGAVLKKLVIWALCGMSALMLGIMSLNGFAAHGTDTLLYKTGKMVSGSAIPGIGSTISGGFDTVSACFTAAGNLCGTAGIVIILFVVAPYIIRTCMLVGVMAVSAFASEFFSCKALSGTFTGFKDAGIVILSSYAFELLVLVFGIALIMLVGG